MILVISHALDEHATAVIGQLKRMGHDPILFDTASFPAGMAINLAYESNKRSGRQAVLDGRIRDLSGISVAWWRRPLPFSLPDGMQGEDRGFAYGECQAAISGLWSCLDAHWVNDPEWDERASRKAYQLKLAASLGLTIPVTLITNDPAAAGAFIDEREKTVYKAFSATENAWRETRLLRPEERASLPAVRYAPVIFQEYIEAVADLRITVIGDQLFPAEVISAKEAYKVDYRMDMHSALIRPHALPPAVARKLFRLMKALNLVYGAIDMRVTPEGEYVFLEINPSGQWLFIEDRTQQPITETFAAYLSSCTKGIGKMKKGKQYRPA